MPVKPVPAPEKDEAETLPVAETAPVVAMSPVAEIPPDKVKEEAVRTLEKVPEVAPTIAPVKDKEVADNAPVNDKDEADKAPENVPVVPTTAPPALDRIELI